MIIVAFPSRAGKCLVQMKVDTERRGVRGGDLPNALGVQPKDTIRPREVSVSTCRADCSVTKTANPCRHFSTNSALFSNIPLLNQCPPVATKVRNEAMGRELCGSIERHGTQSRLCLCGVIFWSGCCSVTIRIRANQDGTICDGAFYVGLAVGACQNFCV